jgi:phosphoribosylformylglycinamidine cyclo-ligase
MKQNAYKEAGVDVDKAAELINRIKPHTARTNRTGVMSGIGGFGALFDLKATGYKDPIIVSATDGVGTKIKIAIDSNTHDTIGIDAVAMCVNDLIVQGAEPLFFLDYFATGRLENDVAEAVIASVAEGCKRSNCALIGGETAEMPGLYAAGDYDLAGFSVGAVERDQMVTGETIRAGDVVLGLQSSGIHSNGYSLVRHILSQNSELSFDSPAPFDQGDTGKTLGAYLLEPTRIYVRAIMAALALKDEATGQPAIKGMVHVTGGGFDENIPRVLPADCMAEIDANQWQLPPIFGWLRDLGQLSPQDLSKTFNCGIGFIVICAANHAETLRDILQENGETVYTIGTIAPKTDEGASSVIMRNIESRWSA